MPTSTDNQDYGESEAKQNIANKDKEKATGPAMGDLALTAKNDENNFTSDDQKGKKIDADLERETDRPGKQE